MTVIRWLGSVALIATVVTPSVAGLPPMAPSPAQWLPITGEAPLFIDADGYVVSITDLDGAE